MGIDKSGNTYTPYCDICGDCLRAEDSYNDACDAMRDEGWQRTKVNGEWVNYCAECREE